MLSMFLIFSSNFAGTDIFPGLPLLRYPSSILPLFPRPPLTLGHIPRALSPIQSSSLALFLASSLTHFPRTLPRILQSLPHIPTNTSSSNHFPASRNHSRHSPHQHLASPIFARPFNHSRQLHKTFPKTPH